jgi:CheY-like chemotaxis protein
MMPIRDGGKIAVQLRADPDVKNIFLTALVTEAEAKAGILIDGHSFFLAKPIDIQELINTIDRHLPERANAMS